MKMSASRLAGAAALALTLSLAAATAHAGNGKAAIDTLPKDTAIVVSIDLDRVKTSPLYQDLVALSRKSPEAAKVLDLLKAEAGFDPARDLHTLVIGASSDFEQSENGVFLMEGKFDLDKLLAVAKKQATNIATANHQGVKYYTIDGKHEIAMLGKMLAATPAGKLKGVIDVFKGKKESLKKNAAFMAKLADADVSKDMWVVMLLPAEVKQQMSAQLGGNTVDAILAAVDIQKGLSTDLRMVASSVAGATALVNLLKTGLAAANGESQLKALGLDGIVSKITVGQVKANVDIGIRMTPEELAKIKTLVGSFM